MDRIEHVVDRLSFGLLLLIPSCIVVCIFIFLAGEYAGFTMIVVPVVLILVYGLGSFAITLLEQKKRIQ